MTDHDSDVAIFWDYAPGYDIIENIRQIAHKYGSVKLFKAYLEISEQPSPNSTRLRSELQSCGVSLTDCPHNGRKDVADKMMIVLVAPNSAHASLRSQASAILDWEADVLGKRAGNANTNIHRRTQSSGSMLVPTHIAQRGARRLSFRETLSTPSTEFLQPSPDIIDPRHRATPSQSNSSAKKPVIPGLSPSSSSVPQSAFVTPIRKNDALPATDDACSSTQGQRSETGTIVDPNDHLRSLDEERSRSIIEPSIASGSETRLDTYMRIPRPCSAPASMPQSEPPTLLEAADYEDRPSVASHPVSDCPDIPILSELAEQLVTEIHRSPAPQIVHNDRLTVVSIELPEPELACMQLSTADAKAATPALSSPVEQARTRDNTPGYPQTSFSTVPTTQLDPAVSAYTPAQRQVPTRFIPLVRALELSWSQGFEAPLYNRVAFTMLQRYPDAYEAAGVSRWKEYESLAEKEGIITVGGSESRPTVSLAPAWQGSAITVSSSTAKAPTSAGSSAPSVLNTPIPSPGYCGSADVSPSVVPQSTTLDGTQKPPILTKIPPPQSVGSPNTLASTIETPRRDIPAQFVPLVRSLERALSLGFDAPMQGNIAHQVGCDYPDAYELAGVKSWTDYAALAEKAGIVISGGPKTKQWMSLAPAWRPMVVLAPASTAGSLSTGNNTNTSTTGQIYSPSSTTSVLGASASGSLSAVEVADIVAVSGPPSRSLNNVPSSATAKESTYVRTSTSQWVTTMGQTPSTPQQDVPPHLNHIAAFSNKSQPRPSASSTSSSQPSPGELKGQAASTQPSPVSGIPLPTVPAKYKTLIQLLEKHRSAGVLQPKCSIIVDALVERERNVYRLAGLQRWREYSDMAVKDGIIKLGGLHAESWVSLEPAWYDRAPKPFW
ncbi:predicted protein [Postia placenta Mad-698-R]|nr:predicted protein [Postia placenta Mad-698-R]